jgi:hypothetical protein
MNGLAGRARAVPQRLKPLVIKGFSHKPKGYINRSLCDRSGCSTIRAARLRQRAHGSAQFARRSIEISSVLCFGNCS